MKKLYIYLVECRIGNASWLYKYIAICENVDEILPMILATGADSKTAYGEPRQQRVNIHSVQKFGICGYAEQDAKLIDVHDYYCDVKPNGRF